MIAHSARRGFAIAFDLLGDRGDAEDAVQDALVITLTELGRLRDPDALEPWFFRVLANRCIRMLRRRRVRNAFARIIVLEREPTQPPIAIDADHVKLLRELDRLPAMQKSALVLRYGHELSLDEIATILDVGVETVKTHLKRGRSRLRDRLGVDR